MEDETHTENIQFYLHPLQSYSQENIFSYAKEILDWQYAGNIVQLMLQITW